MKLPTVLENHVTAAM